MRAFKGCEILFPMSSHTGIRKYAHAQKQEFKLLTIFSDVFEHSELFAIWEAEPCFTAIVNGGGVILICQNSFKRCKKSFVCGVK